MKNKNCKIKVKKQTILSILKCLTSRNSRGQTDVLAVPRAVDVTGA